MTTVVAYRAANSAVRSELPPSETITSCGRVSVAARVRSVDSMIFASFKVGMMIEIMLRSSPLRCRSSCRAVPEGAEQAVQNIEILPEIVAKAGMVQVVVGHRVEVFKKKMVL